jgi:hypothetical protein
VGHCMISVVATRRIGSDGDSSMSIYCWSQKDNMSCRTKTKGVSIM